MGRTGGGYIPIDKKTNVVDTFLDNAKSAVSWTPYLFLGVAAIGGVMIFMWASK